MTLTEFIAKCGSQEKAAQRIGVCLATVSRWRRGLSRPRGLDRRRLEELGIEFHVEKTS